MTPGSVSLKRVESHKGPIDLHEARDAQPLVVVQFLYQLSRSYRGVTHARASLGPPDGSDDVATLPIMTNSLTDFIGNSFSPFDIMRVLPLLPEGDPKPSPIDRTRIHGISTQFRLKNIL